jgi:hypothetical protein
LVDRYDRSQVGEQGFILINDHPQALSLDAHCTECGVRINRRYREHAKLGSRHQQGRPMGSLIAWLLIDCEGAERHRAMYSEAYLPLVIRQQARAWGQGEPHLANCFAKERDPFGFEGDEPEKLA